MAIANSDVNRGWEIKSFRPDSGCQSVRHHWGHGLYDEALDMDHDSVIDITDIAYVAKGFLCSSRKVLIGV